MDRALIIEPKIIPFIGARGAMLFIALYSRIAWFASLFKALSYRLKGPLCNTRRTIVSTTMREWGEAVLFHFLFHSTVCVFN